MLNSLVHHHLTLWTLERVFQETVLPFDLILRQSRMKLNLQVLIASNPLHQTPS